MKRVDSGKAALYHIQLESSASDFTKLNAHKRTEIVQVDSVSDHLINVLTKFKYSSLQFKEIL